MQNTQHRLKAAIFSWESKINKVCVWSLFWTCCVCVCVFQGLLSVTEELHSLSFEACFTVQGLTIDLEVSGGPDCYHSVVVLLWLLFTCANPPRHVLCRWWSSLMSASCLEAGHPSCGTTFWPMNPGWATIIIIKIIITWPWWCARVSVSEFSVQPFWLLRTWRSSVTRLGPPGASSPRSSAGSFPPSLVKASTRSSWACWEKNSSVYFLDFFFAF